VIYQGFEPEELTILRKADTVKPAEDAVGQAILAYHEGRKSFEVVEREDGYFDISGPRLHFENFDSWREHEKKTMNYA
jgi:hypothetical protein